MNRQLFSLVAILGLFESQSARSDSVKPWALLLAQVGDQPLWTLSLQPTKGSCEVLINGPGWTSSKRRQTLEKPQCEELHALLPQAGTDLLRSANEKPEFVTDEPAYQLKIGDGKASVAFKPPETCEILSGGDLRCKTVARSSSERLVFSLRNIASLMKAEVK